MDILVKVVKAVAEGRLGQGPAKVYWALAGIKTYIGMGLAFAYFGLTYFTPEQCADCALWATRVGWLSAFLVTVGLTDKALREGSPLKPNVLK